MGFYSSGGFGYVCIYLPIEGAADSLKRFGSCKLSCPIRNLEAVMICTLLGSRDLHEDVT